MGKINEDNVKRALEDFRLLYCRDPDHEELALKIPGSPEELRKVLYEIAPEMEWKPPTDLVKWSGHNSARERLELAAWLKLECKESSYVQKWWSDDEIEKAQIVQKQYAQYIPELKFYRYKDETLGRIYYHIVWSKMIWTNELKDVIGKNNIKFFGTNIVTPFKSKTFYEKDLGKYLKNLKINLKD